MQKAHMIIDHYLPSFHFSEKHNIRISASPQQVFKTIKQFDTRESKIIRTLVAIRNSYGRFFPRMTATQGIQLGTLAELTQKTGFIQLAEINNQEILFGGVGKPWTPATGFILFQTPVEFLNFNLPHHCKMVWNFFLAESPDGTTILSTETRVCCLGFAKLFFPPYWLVVRLFSGWIRWEMLRLIKKQVQEV